MQLQALQTAPDLHQGALSRIPSEVKLTVPHTGSEKNAWSHLGME